jgi:UDP-2-acetamido-2-deoxy-ribo-hexuluronate aminotransferase
MSGAIPFIDLQAQRNRIEASVRRRMDAVIEAGAFINGQEVTELEAELSRFTGAPYAIACANGTDALQIALMAIGLQPGDEVITPSFTFIATAEAIALLGGRPVFVDVDARTYNIDPELIEAKITPRTRAIMPVSLYGQCADMDAIQAIADRHGLVVIEDAAQSFGASYKGRRSCNLSKIACTSFFPSKPLGCYGDGGMIFTQDATLADRLRMIRGHGSKKRYFHEVVGVNSRLDTLQAAILLAKMEIFEDEIRLRQEAASRYQELLSHFVETPRIEEHNLSVYAQYTIRVRDRGRDHVMKALEAHGVPTTVHYPMALNLQPAMRAYGQAEGTCPISERAGGEVMSLPFHPYLTEEVQMRIANALRIALGA